MELYVRPLSVEEHACIYAGAVFVVLGLLGQHFDQLRQQLDRNTHLGLALIMTGLMSLARGQTLHGIARALGVRSHDTLRNVFISSAWHPALLMAILMQQAVQQALGVPGVPGVLILDDVLIAKRWARRLPFVHWDYDYVNGRRVRCMRVVMLVWTNGLIKIPVGFRLWHKVGCAYLQEQQQPYRTKHQLAREMLEEVIQAHLPFAYLTFDSWYACKDTLGWLSQQGIRFCCVLPCNAQVRLREKPPAQPRRAGRPRRRYGCRELWQVYPAQQTCHYYADLNVRARQIPVRWAGLELTLVAVWHFQTCPWLEEQAQQERGKPKPKRHPHLYILTDIPGLTVRQTIQAYRRRWAIEVLFRDLKQHLGLGAVMIRHRSAGERHLALCLISYVGLERLRHQCAQVTGQPLEDLTIGQIKQDLAQASILVCPQGDTQLILPVPSQPLAKSVFPLVQAALLPDETTRAA